MSGELDIQGILRKCYDDSGPYLKTQVTGVSISIDPGDLRIGAVEIQDDTTGDRVNVTSSNELTTISPTANALLGTIGSDSTALLAVLTDIRDSAGIKKINDALPAGNNRIGTVGINDGTNDLPLVNNGSSWAVPVATDGRQEKTEVLASGTINGGFSSTFNTQTEGYYASRLFIESDTAINLDIFYSADNTEFPTTAFETVTIGAGTFEAATLDVPGWAKYAKIIPDNTAVIAVDVFRSR